MDEYRRRDTYQKDRMNIRKNIVENEVYLKILREINGDKARYLSEINFTSAKSVICRQLKYLIKEGYIEYYGKREKYNIKRIRITPNGMELLLDADMLQSLKFGIERIYYKYDRKRKV